MPPVFSRSNRVASEHRCWATATIISTEVNGGQRGRMESPRSRRCHAGWSPHPWSTVLGQTGELPVRPPLPKDPILGFEPTSLAAQEAQFGASPDGQIVGWVVGDRELLERIKVPAARVEGLRQLADRGQPSWLGPSPDLRLSTRMRARARQS
jgi:hypothetical protein